MGEPIPYRQQLLKRIGLLEFLFDYLEIILDPKLRKPAVSITSRKDQKLWETNISALFKL